MNQNSQENNQAAGNNEYVNPQSMEAEVIGELRKEKIGKPILVFEIFGLLVLVLIALPIVTTMLDNENSMLHKLFFGNVQSPIVEEPKKQEFLDGKVLQPLNANSTIKYENLVMKNFRLENGLIKCIIYSYNDILNLDEEPLYLEIYSTSNNLLAAVKLIGSYDYQETEVELTSYNLNFNENYTYSGKIVEMGSNDYPAVTIASDESGIGSFTCSKDNQKIEYRFQNGYLIGIIDTVKVAYSAQNAQEYLNLKRDYDNKKAIIGDNARVEEGSEGFTFSAQFDLTLPQFSYPEKLIDYNYYNLDTDARLVHYAQIGKGYDCR